MTSALCGAAVVFANAGCGSTSGGAAVPAVSQRGFGWLAADARPRHWSVARLPSGQAVVGVPLGWRTVQGDPGTATAVRYGRHRQIVGYLNLTPRQRGERLATWARFRLAHELAEGNRRATVVSAGMRHLGSALAACVQDDYVTATGSRYREDACLVAAGSRAVVLVGAAPPDHWTAIEPLIRRSFRSLRVH